MSPDYFHTQDLIRDFEPRLDERVFDRSLLIVGLGGNGTHLALAAVRMGFRRVIGIDCDVVSPSNLSRQVLYTTADLGKQKAFAAQESLQRHNLRSQVETHDFNVLNDRQRFGSLVRETDLVFAVLDQVGTGFFVVDACHHLNKPAILGGTCVMSGLTTRVGWMVPGEGPCLNCAIPMHPDANGWINFYRFDGGARKTKTAEAEKWDEEFSLAGGHPSTYPTACIGSNLMMAVALNLFIGRRDVPQLFEFSLLGMKLNQKKLEKRDQCPTCNRS